MNRTLVMTVEEPQSGGRWTYVLKNSPVVMGRDPESCDVALARPSVSKVQAEIAFDESKITYRDLDSRNGSIVDGEPIPADVAVPISLASDIIVGGRLRLTFSGDPSVRASEGVNPFDPPRTKSAVVFEPTAVHVGAIPARPPAVRPPSLQHEAVTPPSRPVAPILQPMPERGARPIMAERVPPTELLPPEQPPPPSDPMEPSPTPIPLNPGDIVAHYRVERMIGRGGMGTVYEVSHTRVSAKRFAMKVLSSEVIGHPEAESRFMREAEAASRINHPHVVSMIDFGRDRGTTYLTMELLEGEDLSALIARRKLPIERIADIMLAVCSGVSAAHQMGIIHRDLKPQNIFLSRTPMGDTVPKVLDFGISKLRTPGDNKLTQAFSLIGTPSYISPEQAEGRPVDARCDVYALGTILYECVTGRLCHEGSTLYEILRSITEADYPRPSQLRPDLQPSFETVIQKALERNPDARFSTVHEMGSALVPYASQKRRPLWKDFYSGSRGDPLESSNFSVVPITMSKYEAPAHPKTEILPVEGAKSVQENPFPKGRRSPVPASVSESPRSSRASAVRSTKRRDSQPSVPPTETPRSMWWPGFIIIGCLLGVAVPGGIMLYRYRSSLNDVRPNQTPAQQAAPPNAAAVVPAQGGVPTEISPPMPSREANTVTPPAAADPVSAPSDKAEPSTASPRHRAASGPPRQSHVGRSQDDRQVRHVRRNRNGIPLLAP
jgi:serine/threonine-protein kinase